MWLTCLSCYTPCFTPDFIGGVLLEVMLTLKVKGEKCVHSIMVTSIVYVIVVDSFLVCLVPVFRLLLLILNA